MIRALLREIDPKTQTRRILKGDLVEWEEGWSLNGDHPVPLDQLPCPYGAPGDTLWVRETWGLYDGEGIAYDYAKGIPKALPDGYHVSYPADDEGGDLRAVFRWRPSIHMPRWASRITLEITSVRLERLQDISEADAVAEGVAEVRSPDMVSIFTTKGYACDIAPNYVHGVPKVGDDWLGHKVTHVVPNPGSLLDTARRSYRKLWEKLNGAGSWDANPYVWVVAFKRVEGGAR
jgi:hypothetical protein